jgi:hypothetical protein
MLITCTDIWPKQVTAEKRYSKTELGRVPNSHAAAAAAERLAFSISLLFTRQSGCLIDTIKKYIYSNGKHGRKNC